MHIVFESSASESGEVTAAHQEDDHKADDDADDDDAYDYDDGDDDDDDDDDDDNDDDKPSTSYRAYRSAYVGRGSVQAYVRPGRKLD